MKIKLLLLFLTLCSPFLATAQFLEKFEGATVGSSSFSSNGQTFNFATLQGGSTFKIQGNYPATGWSGTAVDDRYIDNDGTANTTMPLAFQITSTTPFRTNSFWIYLANISNNLNVTGTLTITGSYNGVTQFTATSTAGFNNTNIGSNNGFTLIDLSTFGGANNSVKNVDALTISTTGNFNYIALDALTWSGALAPVFTAPPASVAICPGVNTSFSVTATNTYGYQWQVNIGSGFNNIANGGVYSGATTATLAITGATAGMNTYQYRCVGTGVPAFPAANSNAATLTINPTPSIATQPVNTSVNVGGNATITAQTSNATGYQWQVDTGSGFNNVTNTAPYSGATTTTLTISNATLGMNGYAYRLVATGACAPAVNSNSAVLTVTNGVISASGTLGNMSTTYGTSSTSQQFNVSGTNLTAGILVTPPTGFEVSSDNTNFGSTVTVGAAGNVASTPLYVRLSSTAGAGSYSGNIQLTSSGASTINVSTLTNGANTIAGAPITIAANNASKTYGQALSTVSGSSAFTLSSGSLKNGNTLNTVTLSYTSGAAANAAATAYPGAIMPSVLTGGNGFLASNYSITYAGGNLTVNPAILSIATANVSKTYGQTLTAASGYTVFTATGLQNSETIGSTSVAYGTGSASTAAVGTYTGSVVLSAATGGTFTASNYTISYTPANIIVGAQSLIITANNANKAYGTALAGATGSTAFTSSGLVNGETVGSVTIAYGTGSAANAAVNTYTGSVTPSAATGGSFTASNYTIGYANGDIIVGAKALTITANNASKTYGTALTGATGSTAFTSSGLVNGETVGSVTIAYATGSASTAAVGTYTGSVTPSAATGGGFTASNYTISYANGDIIVGAKALTITATNANKTYGTALVGATGSTAFTSSGLVNGETVGSVTIAYGTGSAANATVNTYTGSVTPSAATGGSFTASNYTIGYANGDIIVGAKTLTITANNASKTYGTALTGATGSTAFTSSGLVNGETVGSVTIAYGTGSASTAAVGTYTGSVVLSAATGGSFTASNYTISYANGDIIVGAKALTITATNANKAYGTALAGATGSTAFTSSGLVNGETVGSVTIAYGTGSAANAAVNTYAGSVTPSAATGGSFTASNYTISYANGDIIVGAKALNITATNVNKAYGTALAGATGSTAFTSSGLVNGETVGSVTIAYGTGSASTAAVGTYTGSVTPSAATGGTFNASNYTIGYANGDIIVGAKLLTITATNVNKTYGTALAGATGSTAFTASGLVNGETVGSATIAYGTGSASTAAVGTYTGSVVLSAATGGTFTASNYTISYTPANIIVGAKALTITAANANKAYGTALVGATGSTAFTSSGLVNGETVGSVTIAYGTGSASTAAVGTYIGSVVLSAATGGTFTASNYTISYANGDIIVGAKALTITANNASKTYGTALTGATGSTAFTSSGLVNGETVGSVTIAYGTGSAANAAVNTYAGSVAPSAATGGTFTISNYTISYANGDIIVGAKALTITANNASKTYGTALVGATGSTAFTSSGLVNGETVGSVTIAYGTGSAANAAVNTYTGSVTPSAATGGSFTASNYTISYTPANIIVGAQSLIITANNANKAYGTALTGATGSTAFTSSGLVNGETVGSVTIAYGTGSASTAAVGTYTGSVTPSAATGGGFTASNYTISYANGDIIVGAKALTITANNASKTYGTALTGATGSTAFTSSGLVNGETVGSVTIAYGTGSAANAAVNTYTGQVIPSAAIGGSFTASNYSISYANGDIIIGTKTLTITASAGSKIYGDAVNFTGTEFTATGLASGDGITGVTLTSTGAAATATVAGSTYPIIASAATGTGLGNYVISYIDGAMTVTPRALVVASTNRSKFYGEVLLNADFSGSITGIQNGDNITVTRNSTGAVATAAIGNAYPIVATLSDPDSRLGNYTVTNPNGILTVTQKALTITASARTKTYGDVATFAGNEFTSTGLANGDVVTGVTLTSTGGAATATVAGSTYPIVASAAVGTGLGNYSISYVNGAMTVTPRALVVVNNNRSKVYGDVLLNADFTGSITGIQNGDNITVTRNSTGAVATAAIGTTYPIVATLSDPDSRLGNYTVTNPNGILTVAQKALTITASARTKTYGDVATFAGTEFTATGLASGDGITGVTLTSTGAAATATVAGSTYPIIASAATGTGLGNYVISYIDGAMTVTPRALVVVNNNRSKVYGEVLLNADFTGSITGIQNGDNITVTRNSTGAVATAAIGTTYPIVATLSDPGNRLANYTLTNPNGILTVAQKALTITASARTKTYGDAVTFAGTEFSATGLANGDVVTGVTLTSTGAAATATVAGSTYPIVASAATGTGLGNYAISYVNGAMTVTPRALVVVNNNRSKVYGDVLLNADFTGSITGIQNGDNITVTRNSTGAVATAAIGTTYPIVAMLSDPGNRLANYTVTNPNGILTVTQKALTITASARTKTYGDAVVFAGNEFTATGLANGDAITSVTLTSTGAAATATVAGSTYPIVASAAVGTGLGNYTISYVGNVLTVNRKGLTITADNKEKFVGTVNPPLTASYTGFVNGETSSVLTTPVSISTTALTNSPIGNYSINASGAAAANYTIAYINGVLKVKPGAPTSINLATVTLLENKPAGTTAGTLSSTSDDPAATFTYSLVAGTGDTDNALFAISGTSVNTAAILDYETKAIYSILVRSTTQYGFSLDRVLTINLTDVNEAPTMAAIADQTICYTTASQNVALSGISPGPETAQTTTISVSSNNAALFQNLSVSKNGASGTLSYSARSGASGTAIVTVTVRDNGGTANGGVDVVVRTFNITINALPNLVIVSDKGTSVSKGEIIRLTASGGSTYVWSNAAGIISGQNTAVLTVRPSVNTTYTVTATSAAGCSQSMSFTIEVASDFLKLNISNLLTPNGDGFNDKWIIENIDLYPNNQVKVFDKSGRTVYEKKGYDNSWEGTFRGVPLAEDTYYYVVDFGPGFGALKGFITILSSK